jgi:two-component system, OmpR family, phosphate regulon sensor histidine kinase PhoR
VSEPKPTSFEIASALRTAAWVAGISLGALLFGLALGRVWQSLAVAFAVVAVLQGWRLRRFEHWLRRRRFEQPPDFGGSWGEVIAIVSRLYRRKQFHKQRVLAMLREFRRLTSAMPDGAVLLNRDHEILWFNARGGEWLRLERQRDLGFRVDNLVRHPEFVDYLVSAQNEHKPGGNRPVVIPMPGAPNRWVSLYLVASRRAPQSLLIAREVTREVQLETMRREFVANASHELRSPLTVISGYLDAQVAALGEAGESRFAEDWSLPVTEMRRQAERMRSIIDDLLELSKLEDHREPASYEAVDVAGMLAMLRKDVLTAARRPARIELRLESEAKLLGVEGELTSVFTNLLNNAVKYTPDEGEIEIRWWVDAAGGHVSVRDTGVGIAAEHLPRLTERFYRIDAGRSRDQGGSGLGLAIVKHALQRHDSKLEVASELGSGSTFTCHFPLRRLAAGAG